VVHTIVLFGEQEEIIRVGSQKKLKLPSCNYPHVVSNPSAVMFLSVFL